MIKVKTEEKMWIDRIRAGGEQKDAAITAVYNHYHQSSYAYLKKIGASDDEFYTIYHDALTYIAMKELKNFKETASLGTYILAICKRKFYYGLRKKAKGLQIFEDEIPVDLFVEDDLADKKLLNDDFLSKLEGLWSYLGEKCSKNFKMRLEGYDMKEIAQEMDVSYRALISGTARCKDRIRNFLEQDSNQEAKIALKNWIL